MFPCLSCYFVCKTKLLGGGNFNIENMANLIYSNDKGFFKGSSSDGIVVIKPDFEQDYKKNTVEIPEIGIKIRFEHHFKIKHPYLRGNIYIGEKIIPNFVDGCLHVYQINVEGDDWDAFFDKIVMLYDSKFNAELLIFDYFSDFETSFKNDIENLEREHFCQKNDLSNLLETVRKYSDKIVSIINVVNHSIYFDSKCLAKGIIPIFSRILGIYLEKHTSSFIIEDNNFTQLEKNIQDILCYLSAKELILELLKQHNEKLDTKGAVFSDTTDSNRE